MRRSSGALNRLDVRTWNRRGKNDSSWKISNKLEELLRVVVNLEQPIMDYRVSRFAGWQSVLMLSIQF